MSIISLLMLIFYGVFYLIHIIIHLYIPGSSLQTQIPHPPGALPAAFPATAPNHCAFPPLDMMVKRRRRKPSMAFPAKAAFFSQERDALLCILALPPQAETARHMPNTRTAHRAALCAARYPPTCPPKRRSLLQCDLRKAQQRVKAIVRTMQQLALQQLCRFRALPLLPVKGCLHGFPVIRRLCGQAIQSDCAPAKSRALHHF